MAGCRLLQTCQPVCLTGPKSSVSATEGSPSDVYGLPCLPAQTIFLGITSELARCMATANMIESHNSAVRRVSGPVTNYKDAEMPLRWTAAGILEAEKSFKKLRGHAQLQTLIDGLRPDSKQLKKAA